MKKIGILLLVWLFALAPSAFAQTPEARDRLEQERAGVRERVEAKRTEMKERLQGIKDERKKQIAERVYTNLNRLNSRVTDHFVDVLNHLEEVLGRINSRADKAETHGVNVSAVDTQAAAASEAIAQARAKVAEQAGKLYEFQVHTDATLRSDIGKARQQLHEDLSAQRSAVFAARDAVRKAAVTLAQIPRVDEHEAEAPTPTSTGTTTE